MYIHVFLHYPHVSLICLSFLYKTGSRIQGWQKNESLRLIWPGRRNSAHHESHQNNNPFLYAVRRPCPSPPHSRGIQDLLPEYKYELPRNSFVESIPLNRHGSDPEVKGIGRRPFLGGGGGGGRGRRRPRGRVASSLSRTYWGCGRFRGLGLSYDSIGSQCSIPKGYCGGAMPLAKWWIWRLGWLKENEGFTGESRWDVRGAGRSWAVAGGTVEFEPSSVVTAAVALWGVGKTLRLAGVLHCWGNLESWLPWWWPSKAGIVITDS